MTRNSDAGTAAKAMDVQHAIFDMVSAETQRARARLLHKRGQIRRKWYIASLERDSMLARGEDHDPAALVALWDEIERIDAALGRYSDGLPSLDE